jgi:hypothetical protein
VAGRPNKSSQYRGVSWTKKKEKWSAVVSMNGGGKHIGYYLTELEAAKAYDKAARELLGNKAVTNFFEDEDDDRT